MRCPACYSELTEVQAGSLKVDICQGGCGGLWLDAFELQQVDDPQDEVGETLLDIHRDESIVIDTKRKRECPRCAGVKLHRHFFSPRRQVLVDQCPSCGGYWLDAGELAQIRAEKGQTESQTQARQATVSTEFIRYLYRLEGSDRRDA